MAKSENENVYFPHYANARNDRKLRRVRKELGVEGYGIFYMLLEVLREQSDLKYPINDIDLLAEEFGTSEQKIKVVICSYDLFKIDEDELFFSPKQIEYLQPYFAKSKRAKHAALVRWNRDDANALQMHSYGIANAMQAKQSKAKQSKEEQSKSVAESPSDFVKRINQAESKKELRDFWVSYLKTKGKFLNLYQQETMLEIEFKPKTIAEIKNAITKAISNDWRTLVLDDDKRTGKTKGGTLVDDPIEAERIFRLAQEASEALHGSTSDL